MRNRLSNQQRQEQYCNKLKLIDKYIVKSQASHGASFNVEDILTILTTKFVPDPPQQLRPFTPKIILFNENSTKRFIVKQQTAQKGKQFILNVTAHAPAKISIGTNQQKPKVYSLQGTKAILIAALAWKQLHITVSIEKPNMFSSIKLILQQMKIQHKNPKKSSTSLRPNIDKQLEQYLRDTKGKISEIVRSRSMVRIKENQSRRRVSSTATLESAKSLELARTKSDLFQFQKKKTFYIRHVEKMSPEKMKIYKKSEAKYTDLKQRHIAALSKMILVMKLGLHIKEEYLLIRKRRLRHFKINLLCLDFIKIIKNKFRLKMTEKARLRMVNLHYLHMMPGIYYQSSIKKAKKTLIEGLMPYMEFRSLQELAANSEEYLKSVTTLQSFFRFTARSFRDRIRIIVNQLCVIYHMELTEKEKTIAVERYHRQCQEQKMKRFYLNKNRLLEILREGPQ